MCECLMKLQRSPSLKWATQSGKLMAFLSSTSSSTPPILSIDNSTLLQITGDEPTHLEKWLAKYAGGFQ